MLSRPSRHLLHQPTALFLCLVAALWARPCAAYDVLLRWTVPDPQVSGYRLYIGSSSHTYGQPVDVSRPAGSTLAGVVYYSLRGLQPGVGYYMAVTAYSAAMESDYSNERLFNLVAPTAPTANAGADLSGFVGQLFTVGSAPQPGISYLWVQTGGSPVSLSNRTTSRAQFTAAAAGTYKFTVMAYDGQGVAAQDVVSVVVSAPTLTPTPIPTATATRTQTRTPTRVLTPGSTPIASPTGTSAPTRTFTATPASRQTITPTIPVALEDADGDGIADRSDNCPHDFNPAQSDSDKNGRGDMCEADMPAAVTLSRIHLKAAPNGLISIQARVEASEWSSLADALAGGLTIGVVGSGLPVPEVMSFPAAHCVARSAARVSCVGVRGETARFTRQRGGSIYKLTVSAKKRTFAPPLTANAAGVVLSAGGLDRNDSIEHCTVRRSTKSATCKP